MHFPFQSHNCLSKLSSISASTIRPLIRLTRTTVACLSLSVGLRTVTELIEVVVGTLMNERIVALARQLGDEVDSINKTLREERKYSW
jgi:hypothetical protein